ncbi:acyl-CoA dehydrogenase [Devosia ginsengisoli]|uniref:acyl-CoA dehydrogenase n=1 Tax=Devosia ginsengisoli TaxID=400770 RepID=UPI001AEDAD11|nr:acyl-CoA dehydrogenase [Devosia ginsengisoli]
MTTANVHAEAVVDTETLEMLRDSVRRFNEQGGLKRVRKLRGVQPGFDRDAWREMAQQGWLGTIIPEASGGLGLPFAAMQVIVEELARGLSPEPIVGCAVHAATVLLGCRQDNRSPELLVQIASGDKLCAVVEADIAVTHDGARRLTGTARHVLPALAVDGFVVAARDGAETLIVFVDAAAPGISIVPESRADGTFSGTVTFAEVRVSAENVLAEGAAASAALIRGRAAAVLMTAAELFGAMDEALSITLDYMKTRVQFDRPIGSFQALQHRAVDLYIQKELSRSVLSEAIAALDGSDDLELIEMEASRAKARCSAAGMLIGREAIKLHGAIGVTDEYDVGLYLKRLLSLAALHGNAAAHQARYGALLERRQGGLEEGREVTAAAVPAEFMAEQKLAVDWNSFSNDAFRAGIRAYLEAHYPQHLRGLGRRGTPGEMADWLDRMVRKGWIAPAWPVEHGGMGLSPAKQVIFIEERERVGIARNPDQGVVMFGPMLMRYGTDEQKRRFLPKIVTNEYIWCQGYSGTQCWIRPG